MSCTVFIKDKNLKPQNIKKGVTILKVTGTLDASGGGSAVLQDKTVDSSTVSQSVLPGAGYDGLSRVTVNPYTLDSKTVNSSTSQQVVTSSANGLSSVTVEPYELDSKTVDPSTSQQTVNSSVDGLSSVTVTAVTSSIDANISAGNIKKDVTILGVTGTYDPSPVLQDASLSYTQNGTYTLNASSGYDGLGTVTVDVSVAGGGGETPLAIMNYLNLQLTDSEQSTSSCVDTDVVPLEEPTSIEMFFRAPASDPEDESDRHFIFASMAEGEYVDTPFFGAYENAGNLFVNFGSVEGLSLSDADYHFSNGVYIYAEKAEDGGEAYWEVTVNGKPVDNVPYVSLSDMGTITIFGRKDGDGYTEFASNVTCFGYIFMSNDDEGLEIAAGCELTVNDEYDEPEYSTYMSDVPYIKTQAYDYVNETETVNWIPVEAGEYDEISAFNFAINSEPVTAVSGMNVLPLFDDGATLLVNVDTQTKTVNPSTNSQNVTADSGYTALGRVTVNAVTSAIDSNIQESNIKTGVTILGVTGTYSGASVSPMLVTRTTCWDAADNYSIAYNQDPNYQPYIAVSPDHSSTSVTLTVFSNENYQIAPGPNSSLDYQEGGREYTYIVNQVGASDVVAVITTPTFTQTIEVYWEE